VLFTVAGGFRRYIDAREGSNDPALLVLPSTRLHHSEFVRHGNFGITLNLNTTLHHQRDGGTVDFGGSCHVRLFSGLCFALHHHPLLPMQLQRNEDSPARLDSLHHTF
jgi:hypothetical protein